MLDQRITLYVPGTTNTNNPDPSLQAAWTDRTLEFLATRFGGATADAPSTGAYMSPLHGLIKEQITKVYAFADANAVVRHMPAVRAFARRMGRDMRQEVVSVQLNDTLQLIEITAALVA